MSKTAWGIVAGVAVVAAIWGYRQVKLLYAFAWKIKKITTGEISAEKVDVTLDVEMTNKSSISYELTGYSLDVYLDNTFISNVKSKFSQKVPSNGSSILKIVIQLSPKNFLKQENIVSLLTSVINLKKTKLRIKGVVSANAGVVNATNIPIDFSDTIGNLQAPKE